MNSFGECSHSYNEENSYDEMAHTVCEVEESKKQSSFETLTAADIITLMNEYIEDVESILGLPTTTIRILLSHTKWDKDELLSKLTDDNRHEFFAKANVTDPYANETVATKSPEQIVTCGICFTEFPPKEVLGLGCGHRYCESCWRQYLTLKIADEGAAESIQCPTGKCGIIVDDDFIMKLVSDKHVREKYQRLITNSFVQHISMLRWCPAAGCSMAIRDNGLLHGNRQNCECRCGHRCCFNCGNDYHDPIECDLYAKWKKDDNDETAIYLHKNTRRCPNTKCNAPIEKNGGCNYMRCQKCKYEFCWMCFGKWDKENGYDKHGTYEKCSLMKAKDGDEVDDRDRLNHHLTFYAAYKQSLKAEKNINVDDQIENLQKEGVMWNKAKYLKKAVEILCESRKQLMLMCIFAYSVRPNSQKEIFEMNQSYLHLATEQLSMYLEQDITNDNAEDIMKNVQNKATFCELCQNKLREHIYDGFDNDWWQFDKNLC